MTEHLIGRGYRDIAFVSGPDGNFDAAERLRGFRKAVAAAPQRVHAQVLAGDFSEESGVAAGRAVVAAKRRPRAVFAANDMMAIGCLLALGEAGVRVPQDVAVVGFDDIPIARFVTPALSTVRVRIAELGRTALDQLAGRIEAPDKAPSEVATPACEIVVRASCGGS
jgi:LacI family transcriptional regulator